MSPIFRTRTRKIFPIFHPLNPDPFPNPQFFTLWTHTRLKLSKCGSVRVNQQPCLWFYLMLSKFLSFVIDYWSFGYWSLCNWTQRSFSFFVRFLAEVSCHVLSSLFFACFSYNWFLSPFNFVFRIKNSVFFLLFIFIDNFYFWFIFIYRYQSQFTFLCFSFFSLLIGSVCLFMRGEKNCISHQIIKSCDYMPLSIDFSITF